MYPSTGGILTSKTETATLIQERGKNKPTMINLSFNQSSILQRNLFSANNSLATAMKRLSTGLRVNGASDDAAGLSLSTKLSSSINGFNIANQNTQTGISFLNTADGALSTMSQDVQRIRNLAVQAANGVYSNSERNMINNEAQQKLEGIKQTIATTSFGDKKIFNDDERPTYNVNKISESQAIANGYILIKSAQDFINNIPQNGASSAGQTYILMCDIDMSSISSYTPKTNFAGTIKGNGFSISNLTINQPNQSNVSLFGTTQSSAVIENLTLNNFNMTGNNTVSGLIASGSGNITNVSITNSSIKAQGQSAGGLIGKINNTTSLNNCYADANIIGSSDAGGLVGTNSNTTQIWQSSSKGEVQGQYAGGIIGRNNSGALTITESISSASVTGTVGWDGGGIIGLANTAITMQNCFATGELTNASGLIGNENGSSIQNCFAMGKVTGIGGGLIGSGSGTYQNCFWNITTSNKITAKISTNLAGAVGLLDNQMQNSDTFLNANYSNTVWDFGFSGYPKLSWQTQNNVELQIGAEADLNSRIKINTALSMDNIKIDLSNAQGARDAIDKCDQLLQTISDKRSSIGASTNKLQSTLTSNSLRIENLSASKSTLMDTDMAIETAGMMKSQILKQASISLLSKYKNNYSELLLNLLK